MSSKSTAKSLKAKMPEAIGKPQPALPDQSSSQPEELPEWATFTPELYSGYWLMMEEKSVWEQDIELTRAEFIGLKAHLAKLRGYVLPKEPAA